MNSLFVFLLLKKWSYQLAQKYCDVNESRPFSRPNIQNQWSYWICLAIQCAEFLAHASGYFRLIVVVERWNSIHQKFQVPKIQESQTFFAEKAFWGSKLTPQTRYD